jgi:hypothetical protein
VLQSNAFTNYKNEQVVYLGDDLMSYKMQVDCEKTCKWYRKECIEGKHHKQKFPKRIAQRATKVLGLVDLDIYGPMQMEYIWL